MWKTIFALSIALIAVFGVGGPAPPASADGGPHGGYRDTSGSLTDACAACHRVHQGKSEGKLLKAESQYALCLTCHNGAGSRLNVLDGVKLSAEVSPTGLTSRDAGTNMYVSVAPYSEVYAKPGGEAIFTIRVRNTSTSALTSVTPSCSGGTVTSCGSVISSLASAAVGYMNVKATAPAATNTDTITVTLTSVPAGTDATAAVVVKLIAQDASAGATLNGGGFRFVNGEQATSRHDANPADNSLKPWGFGGSGANTYLTNNPSGVTNNTGGNVSDLASALQCTSCHNPHGTANYRLLKEKINAVNVRVRTWYDNDGAGAGAADFVKDEGCPGNSDYGNNACTGSNSRPSDKYTKEYYGSSGGPDANDTSLTTATYGIATICGACHTAYPSQSASHALTAPTASGGSNAVHYRHRTEMPFTAWTNPETSLAPYNAETSGKLSHGGSTGTFVAAETVTVGTTASAKVVTVATGYLMVDSITGTFSVGATITGGTSGATAVVSVALSATDTTFKLPDDKVLTKLRLASNSTNDSTIVTCLTCHRVHGTASTISGYALMKQVGSTVSYTWKGAPSTLAATAADKVQQGTKTAVVAATGDATGETGTLTMDTNVGGLFTTAGGPITIYVGVTTTVRLRITPTANASGTANGSTIAYKWKVAPATTTASADDKVEQITNTGNPGTVNLTGKVAPGGDATGGTGNLTVIHSTASLDTTNVITVYIGSSATVRLRVMPSAVLVGGDNDLTPAQGVIEADGTLSLSSLLYTNNRGMCQACHQW